MKIIENREYVIAIENKNQDACNFVGTREDSGLCQLTILQNEGMMPEHTLFEIGCGALVGSIPFIRYLNKNKYWGVDPNEWLRQDSLSVVRNQDILEKNPVFYSNLNFIPENERKYDYIFAHSIFNHAANWQWESFLDKIISHMKKTTIIIVSVLFSEGNRFGNAGSKQDIWTEWKAQGVIEVNGKYKGDGKGAVAWKSKDFFKNTCSTHGLKCEIIENYTKFYTQYKPNECHDWIRITRS